MTMFFGVLLGKMIGLDGEGNAVVLPLLSKPLVMGCGLRVASAPCRGDLHPIFSKRLFDRGADSPRLAALRRSGELGPLVARVEQARHAREGQVSRGAVLRDNESKERDGRWTGQDDPTEGVLTVVARRLRPVDEALDARFERIEECSSNAGEHHPGQTRHHAADRALERNGKHPPADVHEFIHFLKGVLHRHNVRGFRRDVAVLSHRHAHSRRAKFRGLIRALSAKNSTGRFLS